VLSIARNDQLLMALLTRSCVCSKSLTLNFLQSYKVLQQFLERHGVRRPSSILELGAGERPYMALRFLMEGATRCVVNDIAPMRGFTPELLEHLRTFIDLVWPGSADRLDQLRMPTTTSGVVPIKGLEMCDGRPFEDLDISGDFDLVHSASVLEHVMHPRRVVAKIREWLKPGGYACHSIDLRDHANFEDPLGFLRLTEEQYARNKTENRLRASDWFALFDELSFDLVGREFVIYRSAHDRHLTFTECAPKEEPWVTDRMRQGFTSPFDAKELTDLSTVSIRVLYRKPL
jgi:SAM-dependent methyltransferase